MAVEPDLPEPVRHVASPERDLRVRWDLRVALLGLITVYAALHKLVIPLFLSLTRLSETAYARVDSSLVHALLLFYAVYRRRVGPWLACLVGAGLVLAMAEVASVATGRTGGWLAFSRLLSSLPIGAVCASAASTPEFRGQERWAYLGAAVALIWKGATW